MENNEPQTTTAPAQTAGDRQLAIRQSIVTGDRGLKLANYEDMFRFAQKVAASQFCPPGFSETDCFIALQKGAEVGLSPMQSLESIYVVNNRATLFGDAPKALCEASGLMEDYDQVEIGKWPEDSYGWQVTTKRRGRKPMSHTFTVQDAKIAELWGKKTKSGQSTPWVTAPKRMLLFRARGFNLRDNFGDVLKGLSIGELVDDDAIAGFENAKATSGRVVEPNFDKPAEERQASGASWIPAAAGATVGELPKRRGRPRKEETPAEPPKQEAQKPPETAQDVPAQQEMGIQPSEPTKAPETDLGPKSGPLSEVHKRLAEQKISHERFLLAMHTFAMIDADPADISAGHVPLSKVEEKYLKAALADWQTVLNNLPEV
jgi:hypothetical protein